MSVEGETGACERAVSRCIWRVGGVSVDGERGVSLWRDWSLNVEEEMGVCVCRERRVCV